MCSTRSGVCVIVSDSLSLWKVHWSICWTVDPDKGEIYYIIFTQNRADNQAKGEEIQVSRCTRSSLHNRLTAIFGVLSKILDQKTSLLLDIVVGDFSLNHFFFFFLNCTASRLHGNNYCCPSGDLLSIKVCVWVGGSTKCHVTATSDFKCPNCKILADWVSIQMSWEWDSTINYFGRPPLSLVLPEVSAS